MKTPKLTQEQWKRIGIWSAVVFVILILILLFLPVQEDFLKVGPPEMKAVELENVTVAGYKKGKRAYEITAQYVWSPRTTDRATLENISDGKAYDNGRVVLRDLQARRVYANSAIDELVAQEGVRATVIRKKQKDTEQKEVTVWAENMVYNGQDKKTKVSGTIRLAQNDTQVDAETAQIDHDKDTVTFSEPFKVIHKNIFLTAKSLRTYLNNERFLLEGKAKIIRKKEKLPTGDIDERELAFKKDDLEINADTIDGRLRQEKAQAKLSGRIVVVQKGKRAFADEGFYDEQKDYVELRKAKQGGTVTSSVQSSGQAGLILDKTDWLLNKETLRKLKNPKTRETFSKQTTMLGDILRMRINKKDVTAQGNVKVTQQSKLAYADRAYYIDKEDIIRLYGNVRFQTDDGTWLSADEAVVSLKDNTFRAVGEVESKIMLEK
jgi:hypothetical protein